jgi:hypothetical protein
MTEPKTSDEAAERSAQACTSAQRSALGKAKCFSRGINRVSMIATTPWTPDAVRVNVEDVFLFG